MFHNNLSIIDNIPLYKVDLLISRFIYKKPTILVRFNLGYRYYTRVMYKSELAEYSGRVYKSYVVKSSYPPDWFEFKRYSQDTKNALNLAAELDAVLYLTFSSKNTISTIYGKYQIAGSFAEVVAKTCLLQFLDKHKIELSKENLSEMFKEFDIGDVSDFKELKQPKPKLWKNRPPQCKKGYQYKQDEESTT